MTASRSMKKIKLSHRDVNVLSAISQQKHLPRKFLINYARKLEISTDALVVLEEILRDVSAASVHGPKKKVVTKSGGSRQVKKQEKEVADVFQKWSTAIKRSA